MRRESVKVAVLTLIVLVIVSYTHEILSRFSIYRALHHNRPFYFAESIDKIAGAGLCVLATSLMRGKALRAVGQELGVSASLLPAIAFALIVSSPMAIGFALTRRLSPHLDLPAIFFLTGLSPFVEELEFRGFGVRQLQRGTGWPFWVVVWPSAILFALGHLERGQSIEEMAGMLLLTGAGGVTFAWLVYRWQSLWFAVALHVCMNLWWELFSVARTAIGGWFAFALQNATMLLAIIVTLYWTQPYRRETH